MQLANYSLESKLNQLIGFVKFYRNRHLFMHHLWLFETVTGDLRGCHRDHMAYRVKNVLSDLVQNNCVLL